MELISLICVEAGKAVKKVSDLIQENARVEARFEKRLEEQITKICRSEVEILDLGGFSRFKGRVVTKVLFSVADKKKRLLVPKRRSVAKENVDSEFVREKGCLY